jgi:hypothetical protein
MFAALGCGAAASKAVTPAQGAANMQPEPAVEEDPTAAQSAAKRRSMAIEKGATRLLEQKREERRAFVVALESELASLGPDIEALQVEANRADGARRAELEALADEALDTRESLRRWLDYVYEAPIEGWDAMRMDAADQMSRLRQTLSASGG